MLDPTPFTATSAGTASKARDDHVDDGNDAADDGVEDGADGINDGHQA